MAASNTKLYIYVTNIEEALKDDFAWSLNCSSRDDLEKFDNYLLIKEIEIDMNLDRSALTGKAVDNLDNEIKEIKAKTTAAITSLEARQQNLLALTQS